MSDYTAMRFWFDVGQYIITIAIGVYVWVGNRVNAKSKEVMCLKQDIGVINQRVTRLEGEVGHFLSHEDLGSVYDRINDISDQVSNLSGKMDGVKGAMDMIQSHLINEGGRG